MCVQQFTKAADTSFRLTIHIQRSLRDVLSSHAQSLRLCYSLLAAIGVAGATSMAVPAEANMADSVAEMRDSDETKKVSGRRKKAAKAKQVKPGSFGTPDAVLLSLYGLYLQEHQSITF